MWIIQRLVEDEWTNTVWHSDMALMFDKDGARFSPAYDRSSIESANAFVDGHLARAFPDSMYRVAWREDHA